MLSQSWASPSSAIWNRRRVWLLGAAALIGLLMALGDHGFLYSGVRNVFPALGFVRFPIKFVMLALFTLPLLAAYAMLSLEQTSLEIVRRIEKRMLTIGGILCLFIVLIIGAAHAQPQAQEDWTKSLVNGVGRILVLGLTLILLLQLRSTAETKSGFKLRFLLVILFGLDALTHAPRQNPLVVTLAFESKVAPINLSPKTGESRALLSRHVQSFLDQASNTNALNNCIGNRRAMFADYNLIDGRAKVNGFYSLYLHEQAEIMSLFYQSTNAFPERLADFVGATQITSDDTLFQWNARPTALPLATIGQLPVLMNATNTLRVIDSSGFEPAQQVLLPLEAKSQVPTEAEPGATVRVTSFHHQVIELETSAKAPAMLVLAQCDYPCWRAYVNGVPTDIWKANYAFQAVQVPAGKSQVRMVYEDHNFILGAMISGLTLLTCLVGWFLWRSNAPVMKLAKTS